MTVRLGPGKVAQPRYILGVRPLVRDDLAKLSEARTGAEKSVVQKLRDPHHHVARLLAMGLRPGDVALRSGYSRSRIAILSRDPAFIELISTYRLEVAEGFKDSVDDYYSMATANMLKAERQIAEKLEEADEIGETLPIRDLISISRDAADRFGYGKKQTNVNVNVDFAAQLEKAIKRSGKAEALTIEAQAVLETSLGPVVSPAPAPAVGTIKRRI